MNDVLDKNGVSELTSLIKTYVDEQDNTIKETKQDKLTAGANIIIDSNNVISAEAGISTLIGTTDPTAATVGEVGQFYLNTATNKVFICVSAGDGGSYTWENVQVEPFTTVEMEEICDDIFYPALPAPTNVTASGTTISFDEVQGAESYIVYANGNEIGEVQA